MSTEIRGKRLGRHLLRLGAEGVEFQNLDLYDGIFTFRYSEVAAVLVSEDWVLSIQIGKSIKEMPIDIADPAHQGVVVALIERLRAGERPA